MKLIFSRKGFDSGYGGYPSPILPSGDLVSLPIPDFNRNIRYNNLNTMSGMKYSDLMRELIGQTIRFENNGRVNIDEVGCHLDPDINIITYKREDGWRPLFGQAGSSQSHLRNNNVEIGDIFLFFGWYRETVNTDSGLKFSKNDKIGKHLIYGYFQIGEMYKINEMEPKDWMRYHPHVLRGETAKDNDFLYVARKNLSFNENIPGAGMMKYSKDIVLTKEGMSRTKWNLPDIFRDVSISYHSVNSWKEDYFQSAAKGQEFVVDTTEEIEEWVKNLIISNYKISD